MDESATDIHAMIAGIGEAARTASTALASASAERKSAALVAAAEAVMAARPEIAAENAEDMEEARAKGLSGAMLDRLLLTEDRIRAMAEGLRAVAYVADPVTHALREVQTLVAVGTAVTAGGLAVVDELLVDGREAGADERDLRHGSP